MIVINSTYDELDQKISDLAESEEMADAEEDLIPVENDEAIIVYQPAWRVTDKNLIVVEGVYCNRNGSFWEPDWSLTLVYDDVPDEKFNVKEWIYCEQGTPTTAIHNYINLRYKNA